MKKIGVIVNPVAGLGGSVGLKGSDGENIVEKALELGAVPHAQERAATALLALLPVKDEIELYAGRGLMGEVSAQKAGLTAVPVGRDDKDSDSVGNTSDSIGHTTAEDTIETARKMEALGCELIMFAGGDGTARNIETAVGKRVPVIGIPAGVKIHSAAYATNPRNAGQLALEYVQGKIKQFEDAEVMDIDEEAFRNSQVSARLYGYVKTPLSHVHLQGCKLGSQVDNNAVNGTAQTVIDQMDPDTLYIIGPGSSTVPIMELQGLPATLLGVDLIKNGKLIANDATEKDILAELENSPKAKIVVTPIGGQANLFGRGNQQISPEVIRKVGKENIIIAATRAKIDSFYGNSMIVDTGDEEVNTYLSGYYRVIVAYKQETVFKVSC